MRFRPGFLPEQLRACSAVGDRRLECAGRVPARPGGGQRGRERAGRDGALGPIPLRTAPTTTPSSRKTSSVVAHYGGGRSEGRSRAAAEGVRR